MTADELTALRQRMGMDKSAFAVHVGVTRKTLALYEAGRPIPRVFALACAAVAKNLKPLGD